jgi:hypothetical protein
VELGRRAARASAQGAPTFAIPEAAAAAAHVAATARTEALRREAERWLADGASYHALVRLAARAVLELEGDGSGADFVPKAIGELEPLLRLWPSVLAIPTTTTFGPLDMVALRAFPVHPLGLVVQPTWADGRPCSPAEYFFHDVDHARFKIREDLRVENVELPDAYRDGSTLDPQTGQHRTILAAAEGRIGTRLWDRVEARRALAQRLLTFAASLGGARARAAEELLFEVIYEKSHPLDRAALDRELSSDEHVVKIRRKRASGFFGDHAPDDATMAALDEARLALRELL